MSIWKRIWEGWKRVGGKIGDFMGRLILTLFYFTLFLPFGLIMRFFSDPLTLKTKDSPSWQPRDEDQATLDSARRLS